MAELQITQLAQLDLDGLFDYIALHLGSPLAAHRKVKAILERARMLQSFPRSGTPFDPVRGDGFEYRCAPSEGYVIIYHVDSEKDAVYVDRVVHASSDYRNVAL